MLGDRTNYVNSKYASVNQIMSNNSAKNSYLTKSTNNHLRLGSTHDYSALKNINGEFSKNIYCSNDKRTDLKERKQK
jgi:phage gpG-like protein